MSVSTIAKTEAVQTTTPLDIRLKVVGWEGPVVFDKKHVPDFGDMTAEQFNYFVGWLEEHKDRTKKFHNGEIEKWKHDGSNPSAFELGLPGKTLFCYEHMAKCVRQQISLRNGDHVPDWLLLKQRTDVNY